MNKDELRDAATNIKTSEVERTWQAYLTLPYRSKSEYKALVHGYAAGYEAGKPKWIPIRSADDLAQPEGLYWVTCQIDGRRFTATAVLSVDDELPGNAVAFCRISEPEPYTEGE